MTTKTLSMAINEGQAALIKVLEENPEQWEIDKENPYQGKYPVRLFLEKRDDDQNPSGIVLMTDKEDLKPLDVAILVYERIVEEKIDISIKPTQDMFNGKSFPNIEMMEGLLKYTLPVTVFGAKVMNSHKLDLIEFENRLIEKGFDPEKISESDNDLLILGRTALLNNTMANGECSIPSARHLIDHLLTDQCKSKLTKGSIIFSSIYEKLERARLPEVTEKKKSKRKPRM